MSVRRKDRDCAVNAWWEHGRICDRASKYLGDSEAKETDEGWRNHTVRILSYRVQRLNKFAQLARVCSNRELRKVAKLFEGDVVNVSGWLDEDGEGSHYKNYFGRATSYTITNYHGERGYQNREDEILLDLSQPLPDSLRRQFDVVFNHTTLEHVFDCQLAFKNLSEMSRDVLIVVVPFCQCSHELESFKDYWRFTPSALRTMYGRVDMTVIYEASNQHVGAASYLFFVGSRKPEQYLDKMLPWEPLGKQCAWIGRRRWLGLLNSLLIERCGRDKR